MTLFGKFARRRNVAAIIDLTDINFRSIFCTDMKKILLICTNADEAGAPRHVESLIFALKDKVSFTAVFGENGPVEERLRRSGCEVFVVKSLRSEINILNDILAIKEIIAICHKIHPDLIHCHSTKAGMVGRIAALLTSTPWIYTVHGWGWRGMSRIRAIIITLIEFILRFTPRGHYIYVAKAVEDQGRQALGIPKIMGTVIYNGIAGNAGPVVDCSDKYIILMPARVSSAKDHNLLLRAFEAANIANSSLILCGEGTLDQDFIKLAKLICLKSFSRISFEGQRSDISRYFERASLVVLVSHFEALPISIIEAMSFSKPVIASNVGGVSELIGHGVNGRLIDRGDLDGLINALVSYQDFDMRLSQGCESLKKFDSLFTLNQMASKIKDLYGDRFETSRN
jgi:glycosyltransferase involved in cell wall biosynthesis